MRNSSEYEVLERSGSSGSEGDDESDAWSTTDDEENRKSDQHQRGGLRKKFFNVFNRHRFEEAVPKAGKGSAVDYAQKHREELELKQLMTLMKPKARRKSPDPYQLKFNSSLLYNQRGLRIVEPEPKTLDRLETLSRAIETNILEKRRREVPKSHKPFVGFTPDEVLEGLLGVPSRELQNFLRLPQEGLMQLLYEYWCYMNDKYSKKEESEFESYSESVTETSGDEASEAKANAKSEPPPTSQDVVNGRAAKVEERLTAEVQETLRLTKALEPMHAAIEMSDEDYENPDLQTVLIQDAVSNINVNYGKRFGVLGTTWRYSYTFVSDKICTPILSTLQLCLKLRDRLSESPQHQTQTNAKV
jgi:hypothetical protein